MKSRMTCCLIILFCCACCTAESIFIADGRAKGPIIIAVTASQLESYAARELQTYLRKVTDVNVPIIASDTITKSPCIIIGNHPLAKHHKITLTLKYKGSKDAIAAVRDGNCLFLFGASETATTWAVWNWLESLGVRWLMPTNHGEYVPQLTSISLPAESSAECPRFDCRGQSYIPPKNPAGTTRADYELFTARMRTNLNYCMDMKDCWINIGSGHSYSHYLPADRYFDKHPEWFNLIAGQRIKGEGVQVCFTNSDAAKEFAKNVCEEVNMYEAKYNIPVSRMNLCVTPNDLAARCECGTCQKLMDSDGSYSSLVLNFTNMVAEEVHTIYPDAKVVYYVYDNYGTIPEHILPAKGVAPQIVFWTLATGTAANHAYSMFSPANKRYTDVFKWFAERVDAVSVYNYYAHYNWFTPWPQQTQLSGDLKYLASVNNCYGIYSENHFHWGTQALNLYILAKLMWDPNQSFDSLVNDFCEKAYGAASQNFINYYNYLQQQMDKLAYVSGEMVEIPSLLTPEVIEKCDKEIASAKQYLNRMDAETKWRTELAIKSWEQSVKFAKALRLLILGKTIDDLQLVRKLVTDVNGFMQTELGQFAFKYDILEPQMKVLTDQLALDLNNLQPGINRFSDSCKYGGVSKFWASKNQLVPGLWGFSVPMGNEEAILTIPLSSAKGRQITKLKISAGLVPSKHLQIRLAVVNKNLEERIVSQDAEKIASGVMAEGAVPAENIAVVLGFKNTGNSEVVVLTSLAFEIVVE